MNKRLPHILAAILALLAFGLAACQPAPSATPAAPTGQTPTSAAPLVSEVRPVGAPQERDLQTTTQVVRNCDGLADLTRHPSMAIITSHSVEWELGAEVGVGTTIGGGLLPADVEISTSFHATTIVGSETAKEISESWDLTAPPGTAMEFTIRWWEEWQQGEVLVTFPGVEPYAVTVFYRVGINSDMVQQRQLACGQATPALPALVFAVREDFSAGSLAPNFGVGAEYEPPGIRDGLLNMDISSAKGYSGNSIFIANGDNQFALLAGSLAINSARGEAYSHLQVQLGVIEGQDWYANFGLNSAGEIFLALAPAGSAPLQVLTWPGKPLGEYNELVIVFDGSARNFFANGEFLYTLQAEEGGRWANLAVGAVGNAAIKSRWNWLGWAYR